VFWDLYNGRTEKKPFLGATLYVLILIEEESGKKAEISSFTPIQGLELSRKKG
jgi:hypothetical protein